MKKNVVGVVIVFLNLIFSLVIQLSYIEIIIKCGYGGEQMDGREIVFQIFRSYISDLRIRKLVCGLLEDIGL